MARERSRVVSASSHVPASALAEINVTPLIDVLLVLLIAFMLVAPVVPRALDAGLPAQGGGKQPTAALIVSADEQVLLLDGRPVDGLVELESLSREMLATRADKNVFVRARGVRYGYVIEVMDALRASGAGRIGVMPFR